MVDRADFFLYRPCDHPRIVLLDLLDHLILQFGVEEVLADGFVWELLVVGGVDDMDR